MVTLARSVMIVLAFAMVLSACTTREVLEIRPLTLANMQPDKYAAIVMDAETGSVLYSAAPREPRYPASLTKMMTVFMMFDAMEAGRMTRSTPIPVSDYAASRPASKLYLKAGSTIDADTAIRALVVKSANDVATAVAEYLGGSEENFARQMTARARTLGMNSTVFRNASGLPDDEMRTTAEDMARLAVALRRTHGRHYGYFALRSFEWNGQEVRGHNRVLDQVAGADGLKTGYIRASGFNLATSARRNGRSYVAIVMGGRSGSERDEHMVELLNAAMGANRRR